MMTYLLPTNTTAMMLIARGMEAQVTMLSLLKFRDIADYSRAPYLAPPAPISGRAAYSLYADAILPHLHASGGDLLFQGDGGAWFIGPEAEGWDHILLVRQASVAAFLAFAQDPAIATIGQHRTAALADSRLLPMTTAI